ncbi:MAG: glycosyltransferase family 2 protein [Bacteroidota bacterium]|nr:glycosyltransferase family 2 protein [Bacteroidota bacterium]
MNIAVIIPCYKVENHIENVINTLPSIITYIIVVNDCSPDNTKLILNKIGTTNNKVIYLEHTQNQGVGGAMKTGFVKALELNADIIIKLDGDGQMNPKYIPEFIKPIIEGKADFTKGNRFRNYRTIQRMPIIRRIGNLGLSFLTKAASGYWNIFDPTNGYFAMNITTLKLINLETLHNRYFFESSLLIEMYHSDTVIQDIPIDAQYGEEISNLSVTKTLFEFPPKLFLAFIKRILFKYFLYDFNIASIYIMLGFPIFTLGAWYGLINYIKYTHLHIVAPTGTVVIPTLLITLGFQLILSAVNFDVSNYPKK